MVFWGVAVGGDVVKKTVGSRKVVLGGGGLVGGKLAHIDTDRFRGGKNGTKIIIDNVDGGHEGVGGYNRMEKSVDSGKGGCVGPYFVVYIYSVSSYIVHLTLLFLSLFTSSHFSLTTRLR